MNAEKIQTILSGMGHKSGWVKQTMKEIRHAAFKQLVSTWAEAKDLPPELCERLDREAPISSLALSREVVSADDKTIKAALTTVDGHVIESVLMIHPPSHSFGGLSKLDSFDTTASRPRGTHDDGRRTVCVSSQVGCPMGCAFCATGKLGFTRNLTAEEIIDQVLFFARRLGRENSGATVTNIVVMGMGEPMHNLDAVLETFRELNGPDALSLGGRHFAISTCGIVPGIRCLADANIQVNLAVSLHAPNQALRERLMPVAKSYPLDQLMAACRDYVEKTGRKIMFEYLLIEGLNDGEAEAEELALLMDHPLYHVNLIKYHTTGAFKTSPIERRERFQRILWDQHHVPVTTRTSFGEDIDAACGQLAGKKI